MGLWRNGISIYYIHNLLVGILKKANLIFGIEYFKYIMYKVHLCKYMQIVNKKLLMYYFQTKKNILINIDYPDFS